MRRLTVLTVACALALAFLSAPSASADESHRYVALGLSAFTGGLGGDATASSELGTVRTTAVVDRITITVDDDVITDGTIRVVINDRTPFARYLCVEAGTPTLVAGLRPGDPVSVTVAAVPFATGCDSGGTTGTLTIAQ